MENMRIYEKPQMEYWPAAKLNQINAEMSGEDDYYDWLLIDTIMNYGDQGGAFTEVVEDVKNAAVGIAETLLTWVRSVYSDYITNRSYDLQLELIYKCEQKTATISDVALSLFVNSLADSNYEKNREIIGNEECEYATLQGNGGWTDELRFGLKTMSYNGCEIMATYNVLYDLSLSDDSSYYTDICDIAKYFEKNGSILFGLFGTAPSYIASYLRKRFSELGSDYEVEFYTDSDSEQYDILFQNRNIGIITFWWGEDVFSINDWKIHTVMFKRQNSGANKITAYNMLPHKEAMSNYDSIANMIEKPRSSTGRSLVPISLICIKES